MNGLSTQNGLSGINGLSGTNGLMTTDGGRQTVKYLVRCALAANDTLTKQDQYGVSYTFQGGMGLCPAWKNGSVHGTNFRTCQNLVSACMMAHVNTAGVHIPIWMTSEAPQIGWGLDLVNYPQQEGTFFGNIMETGDLTQMGMAGVIGPVAYYCEGAGFADGTVKGRLGMGQSGANLPYKNQYGGTCHGNYNFVGHWSNGNSGGKPADGYKTANVNGYVFQNGEPITVWRNEHVGNVVPEPVQPVVRLPADAEARERQVGGRGLWLDHNGTAVQQWGTNSNTAQKFAILASGSNWKIAMKINTNKCIGPAGNGTGNSTALEIQDCNGGNAQAWTATLVSGTTDTFNFKNVASNRCMDVQGYSTADGARMQLYDCTGGNNQKFAVAVN